MSRLVAVLLLCIAFHGGAAEPTFGVTIENHRFTPDRIEVPAGQKVRFIVENKDATPEEFESVPLRVEKVIPGKASASVFIGPLKAGEYKFVGEFNEATAHGVIVAK